MTKQEFVWTVGFNGNTAIINRQMKERNKDLSPKNLLEQGLVRPAVCSALWDSQTNVGALDEFAKQFSQKTAIEIDADGLKRLVGVYTIPQNIRTLAL